MRKRLAYLSQTIADSVMNIACVADIVHLLNEYIEKREFSFLPIKKILFFLRGLVHDQSGWSSTSCHSEMTILLQNLDSITRAVRKWTYCNKALN